MRTNTQYVRDETKAEHYRKKFIALSEMYGMGKKRLEDHFANVALANSIMHKINVVRYDAWDTYEQFPKLKVAKRYRVKNRG